MVVNLEKRVLKENIQWLILVSSKKLRTYMTIIAVHLQTGVCTKMLSLFNNVRNLRCNYYQMFIHVLYALYMHKSSFKLMCFIFPVKNNLQAEKVRRNNAKSESKTKRSIEIIRV